jgi:hypothetical protein
MKLMSAAQSSMGVGVLLRSLANFQSANYWVLYGMLPRVYSFLYKILCFRLLPHIPQLQFTFFILSL